MTDAIEEAPMSLSRMYGVKSLKALPGADLSLSQIKADTGEAFVPVSIEDAMKYWFSLAKKGNAIASAIIEAALVEAIERRADSAFGKSRTEEERNIRFKARMEGKETRRSLTDAIKSYIDRTPNLSENTLKFLYSNVTDATYRALFGRSCKVLTKDL